MTSRPSYLEETKAYLNDSERKKIIWELLVYALMLYKRVYAFQNLEILSRDFSGDPPKEYWEILHYEKLIDTIKICTAFENFNKAILLSKGYLVHEIDAKKNKKLAKKQKDELITIDEFLESNEFIQDNPYEKFYLSGLRKNFGTISFSQTLDEVHQKIIGLDNKFLGYLKNLNKSRNRLHFYKNYASASRMNSLVESLEFAKSYGTQLLIDEIEKLNSDRIVTEK